MPFEAFVHAPFYVCALNMFSVPPSRPARRATWRVRCVQYGTTTVHELTAPDASILLMAQRERYVLLITHAIVTVCYSTRVYACRLPAHATARVRRHSLRYYYPAVDRHITDDAIIIKTGPGSFQIVLFRH